MYTVWTHLSLSAFAEITLPAVIKGSTNLQVKNFPKPTFIMFAIFISTVVVLSLFMSAASLQCPSTCPMFVTERGNSNCCSVGDGAAGCGICEFATCADNNFGPCEETFGTECSLAGSSCQVSAAGGTLCSP